MIIIPKFNFDDPLGLCRRYTKSQRNIDPGTAMLIAGAVSGGSALAGGLIGGKSGSVKAKTTFSPRQQQIDSVIYDLLMGVKRDSSGFELSRDPWIMRLMEKRQPIQKVAPFTSGQKQIQSMAQGMLPKLASRSGPDKAYLENLQQGILPSKMNKHPNMYYAATGASANSGDRVVVGEDGPEIIEVQPDGSVKVIPNPKTMKSPASIERGLQKSRKVQKQLGANYGLVTGGIVEPRKKLGDEYLPYEPGADGNYWDKTQDWTAGAQSQFEQSLADKYSTGAVPHWYSLFGTDYPGLWDKGDISSVPYANPAGQQLYGGYGAIHTGYSDELRNWWDQMETVTGRPEVSTALEGITPSGSQHFSDWWSGSAYNDPANQLVTRGGKVEFDDPYSVDLANLQAAMPEYQAYYASEGQPGYVAPEAPAGPDWGALMTQIPTDQQHAFNQYLNEYQGGVLADKGIAWNPATAGSQFMSPDEYYPGMSAAVESFLSRPPTDPTDVTPTDTTVTDTGLPDVGSEDMLKSLYGAITPYTESFDPAQSREYFREAIADPTRDEFGREVIPDIRQSFAGSNFFGSGREKAEVQSRERMESDLSRDRAAYVATSEQAHKSRALQATSQLQELYKLPSSVRGQEASTENINAVTASVFNNMAWTNSLNEANLDNQTLSSLAMLWQLFQPEQQYDQDVLNAEMTNAFNADGGFTFASILPLIMGYQDQSQIAYVS